MHKSQVRPQTKVVSKLRSFMSPALAGAFVFAAGSMANATVTIGSVGNASFVDQTTSPWVVYGGLAGPPPSQFTTGLYNNCEIATGGLAPCNSARIHAEALLTISFRSDSGTGRPALFYTGGTTPVLIQPDISSPTSATANSDTTVVVAWKSICAALVSNHTGAGDKIDSACNYVNAASGAVEANFKVGFTATATDTTQTGDSGDIKIVVSGDTGQLAGTGESFTDDCGDSTYGNPFGICGWEIMPGDEKATLGNVTPHAGRSGPALEFRGVRVLYQELDRSNYIDSTLRSTALWQTITAASKHADLTIESGDNGVISIIGRVEGLRNDQSYIFKVGMIDLAGNVGFYTPNTTGAGDGDLFCPTGTARRQFTCHVATPGEVVGVLAKDVNCFIATAAFGSSMAPQVQTFREFRNKYLLTNQWGTKFVRFYYKHSPKYAKIIADSKILRAASRVMLWPLLAYAWLAVQIGAKAAFALMGLLLLTVFLVGYRIANENDDQGSSRA